MGRYSWMTFRMFAPALGVFLLALVAGVGVSSLSHAPLLGGVYRVARWLPFCAVLTGVAMMGWAAFRLLRWREGHGLNCSCGGLLGRENDGRYGPYRTCLACRKNVAQRHYVT